MKREIISGILLIMMLVGGLAASSYLQSISERAYESIDKAISAAEEGLWTESVHHAEEAVTEWKKHTNVIGIFFRHSEISEITDALYDMMTETGKGDAEAVSAKGHAAAARLRDMTEMQKLSFQNIF